MKDYLTLVQEGKSLSEDQMFAVMTQIMEGKAEPGQIGALLMGLSMQGETVEELSGAARVLREKAASIKAPFGAVDCCGTGGDGLGTYNISTAVAIVAAACGVPVAKHGNRASSSKSGAADVLEALGVNLQAPLSVVEDALGRTNFGFLMATNHHEAMKHVVPVRKSLGMRTMFNLLGPLANPAGARLQLLGVYDRKWVLPMAETLKKLGAKRAWVVHGSDGLDEITITGPTHAAVLADGEITEQEITPADFDIAEGKLDDLIGGSAEENAAALRALLEKCPNAYRDIVIANTAAVIHLHTPDTDLKAAAAQAGDAIDSGHAYETLRDYIALSRREHVENAET